MLAILSLSAVDSGMGPLCFEKSKIPGVSPFVSFNNYTFDRDCNQTFQYIVNMNGTHNPVENATLKGAGLRVFKQNLHEDAATETFDLALCVKDCFKN